MRRIKARVIRNIGTESKWLEKNPVLGDGEMALVRFGGRVRQKIGNGSLRFSDLSYQDNDLKIPAIDTSFPFLSGEGPAPEGIYFAKESGTYQPGNVEVDTSGKMVMLVWDGVGELEKVETEMPEVEGVDVLNPYGDKLPKERAIADYAPSKTSIGLFEVADQGNIGEILSKTYINDSTKFISGFLRSNGTVGASEVWATTMEYNDILPGLYTSNLILEGNSSMLIYNHNKDIIQVIQSKGKYDGSEDWQLEVLEGARYYKTSRSTGSISATVDFYIKSVGDKRLVTDKAFIPSEGYEDRVSEAFESRGFIKIEKDTNILSELTGSDIEDTSLWSSGFLHYNGTVVPGGNWRYSEKIYRVYPGKYILQSYFGGNARLWVLDIDGNIVRQIENEGSYAYSSEENFTSSEAYIRISFLKSGTGTSWIQCRAVEDIDFFTGSSKINITSSIKNSDIQNAVNGLGVSNGILSSLKSSVKPRNKFPIVTFISDDIHVENFNWYIPALNANGIKSTFAFITDRAGANPDYATNEQVLDLYRNGHDIASHTCTHRYTADLTEDEQVKEIAGSKIKIMNIIGDDCPIFVPPFGSQSAAVTERIVRQYYDLSVITVGTASVGSGECCNNSPLDTYRAKRVSFDASSSDQNQRLQLCKDAVDICFANSEWLIFAIHPQYPEYSESANPEGFEQRRQDLTDLIEYIKSKNIPIMTAKNALSLWRNPLELGNKRLEDNYYYVGMDGAVEGSYFE